MTYMTKRQSNIGIGFLCLLSTFCFGGWVLLAREEDDHFAVVKAVIIFLVGILSLIFFLTYNVKRSIFKRHGKCIPGKIIGAESVYGRYENSCHLMISFYDNGEKVLYTEAYKGYPSSRLKSTNCNVYKWKGKYIEADLDLKSKKEIYQRLMIPIQERKKNSPWKVGKVKEV